MTLHSRILELALLPAGWLDGKEPPLSRAGLGWLELQLLRACTHGLPVPWIFPTPEGNVSLEWSFGSWHPSLEVNIVHRTGEFHTCDVDATDGDHAERAFSDIDLHDFEGWLFVVSEIERDRIAADL